MRPICIHCQLLYQPLKNGISFEEGMPVGDHTFTIPGSDGIELDTHSKSNVLRCALCRQLRFAHWGPYKLWIGDQYECPGCSTQIIIGVPNKPLAEHYMPNYAETVNQYPPYLRVNDC